MQAISIIGFSNSGKTTLISRLSECLEARGLKVAIAKHTHHELDKPDTDTALLMGPKRTIVGLSNTKDGKGEAMIHWGHPCFLRDLVPLLDADILLVEGGKNIGWLPRILCLRTTPELLTALPEGCKALRPELALATYGDNKLPGLPSFTAEDLDALVDLVLEKGFLLPALDCGACGEADCTAMTSTSWLEDARRLRGRARSIEVTVNGQSWGLIPLRRRCFPAASRDARCAQGMVPGGEVIIRMKG
ncbi:molybdopterin-guanine dinucleotide biosynthesis protein MobB [Bilophila wadsworthia]|uniref:molybdopterin-guanine dinucleotide biosynthesis protein MobB n=1 Tax=Bilophila wadsworthia TaxID=35833 RepID=UPI00399CE6D4